MHELSVCHALVSEVELVAASHGATTVERIVVSVGPLSGVEPSLLASAFTIARENTVAAEAELEIESSSIVVRCSHCGHEGPALVNRLVCGDCGNWRVSVTHGEELFLMRVDLAGDFDEAEPDNSKPEDRIHV